MIETALLERGLLGVLVLALGLAVIRLYNELSAQRDRHREEMNRLQVSFTDTSRDHHEQMLEAHRDFTNRLLSIVTSQAELPSLPAHTGAGIFSASHCRSSSRPCASAMNMSYPDALFSLTK